MTVKLFAREMWRTILFFVIGYSLIIATISLSTIGTNSLHKNLIYAYILGLFALLVYLIVEYVLRRSFYIETLTRLQNPISLPDVFTMSGAGTPEQRLFIQLLQVYHGEYMRQLDALTEQQRIHEVFSTQFAHQMKTPITVIQLLEQEMRALYATSPDILDCLDSLSEERLRIETTVGIMLNTTRLGSFSVDTRMQDIELTELVREVMNEHKSQWIRRSIYPKIESDFTSVYVKSDRKWLLFIIDQIARNALQYGCKVDLNEDSTTEPSTFLIRVSVQTNRVEVSFVDHGIGIPARDIDHIFEPFYTGSNGRSHSRATGMGLYLVKEVADRLGHTIHVDSVEGCGTTVKLTVFSSDYLQPVQLISNMSTL